MLIIWNVSAAAAIVSLPPAPVIYLRLWWLVLKFFNRRNSRKDGTEAVVAAAENFLQL